MFKLFSLLFILIFMNNVFAGKDFNLANELYKAKNFDSAIELYEKLLSQGTESPELYYNLGNSYFRVGKLGQSILNLEKAHRLSPFDEDIKHNLDFVNSRITDKVEPLPKFFLFEWWENFSALLSINGWSYIGYSLYIVTLILIMLFIFNRSGNAKRKLFFSVLFTSILLLISILIISSKWFYDSSNIFAIITDQRVQVKNSPDEKGSDLFIIHDGLKIKIEDSVDEWAKIKLSDGKVGWIKKNQFSQI
ncbi:MAG: tetratricopeptide repeat protein [Ignavibacteriaceae bacterium]|nr:tetratricopeptide repeat protein [Ignavibacteriaceae bacterium]